ncbi:hypothetical protein [Pedobacter rhodius]|uniref:DUF3108 domain-containing protein n=1 Tax=Pedobacter rhodius TaxID=3004098 RepID=A0ABT4KVR4_9SPHI|nr:hypothetical protein [Pedobacter sp. SJ11]MCZ4221953.1 hypothetical protein [Pedobacter sp. SJ11]
MRKLLLSTALLFVFTATLMAQVDTINAENHKLLVDRLRAGKSSYLVYMTDSLESKRTVGDIWERTISFGKKNQNDVVEFGWKWIHNDSLFASITNICDRKTLAPIYHYANYKRRGIFAYNYKNGFMQPADTVKNNGALKKAPVKLDIPIISWEQDLETYPLLPIKKVGQQFDISFFDPNEKSATYHRYEVTGKDELKLNADVIAKCWLLRINYSKDSYAVFWLTEKSKEVIKMKEYYKGNYRIKVKQY